MSVADIATVGASPSRARPAVSRSSTKHVFDLHHRHASSLSRVPSMSSVMLYNNDQPTLPRSKRASGAFHSRLASISALTAFNSAKRGRTPVPLPSIPLDITSFRNGDLRVTPIMPDAPAPVLTPLGGVSLAIIPESHDHPATTKPVRRSRCPRRLPWFDTSTPLDSYVRVTVLPSGVGQITEVVRDSGTDVTWKRPQRLTLPFDGILEEPSSASVEGEPVASAIPENKVVVLSRVASLSSRAEREPPYDFFVPSPSFHGQNKHHRRADTADADEELFRRVTPSTPGTLRPPLRDDPAILALTNSSTCSTASATPAVDHSRHTITPTAGAPPSPSITTYPTRDAGITPKFPTHIDSPPPQPAETTTAPAAAASDPAQLSGAMLLIEVICCAPERDSSEPCVEVDRLVASGTWELLPVLTSPGKPLTIRLQLIDLEHLEEAGEVSMTVEFDPDEHGGDLATSRSGTNPGSGTLHVEVLSAKSFIDPFNAVEVDMLDWSLMRRMVAVVFLYLAAGVAFYTTAEGWSFLNSVYFVLVTATTTGYGDLEPTTDGSRVFTIFFILVGIGLIAVALGIAGGLLLERQEQEMYNQLIADRERSDAKTKEPWLGRNTRRMLTSFVLFNAVLWGGTIGFYYLEDDLSFLDSVYLCVITISTVGYGNGSPKTKAGRAFCCPWIVVSALVVTRIVGEATDVYMAFTRAKRAELVLKSSINSVEDLAALDDDGSGSVDELEFLKHMLVKTHAASQREIDAICSQFRALDQDNSGVLDAADFKKAAANNHTKKLQIIRRSHTSHAAPFVASAVPTTRTSTPIHPTAA